MKHGLKLPTLFLLGILPLGALAAEPTPAATPGSAASREPPAAPAAREQAPTLFQQLDANHDGFVNKEEAKRSADVTARFKDFDSDRDGKISLAEYKKGHPAAGEGMSGPAGETREAAPASRY